MSWFNLNYIEKHGFFRSKENEKLHEGVIRFYKTGLIITYKVGYDDMYEAVSGHLSNEYKIITENNMWKFYEFVVAE